MNNIKPFRGVWSKARLNDRYKIEAAICFYRSRGIFSFGHRSYHKNMQIRTKPLCHMQGAPMDKNKKGLHKHPIMSLALASSS